jgi:alpha-methylacyl-CoA racemase
VTSRALIGVTVVELAGIGPAPFACTFLSDLGATIIRIERPGGSKNPLGSLGRISGRNRTVVELDMKTDEGLDVVLTLIENADVLVEGFRPGTTERMGLGPAEVRAVNPGLVYARITGWGQDGPYAAMAGHDINYIGLSGVLAAIGAETPVPPLNLVADYGGGAMFAIAGILAALVERQTTGEGQVVDVAMIDGSASLLGPIRELNEAGLWREERAANVLDGAAPYYRTYATSDGKFVAVGAIEPVFYEALIQGLGLDAGDLSDRLDPHNWEELSSRLSAVFLARTRDEWAEHFAGTDACVTPVLTMSEVGSHRHNKARGALVEHNGAELPAPAPRMGSYDTEPAPRPDLDAVLRSFGLDGSVVDDLVARGVAYPV